MTLNDIVSKHYTEKRFFINTDDDYIDVTEKKAILYGVTGPSFKTFD